MTEVLVALLMGVIQGLTEFLPVSSSGHLVIAQTLVQMKESHLLMTVAVHFGTILAVLLFCRREILELVKGFFSGLGEMIRSKSPGDVYRSNENFRLSLLICLATIPAGLIGLTLKDLLEQTFSSPLMVGINLLITGILLLLTKRVVVSDTDRSTFTARHALIIGCVQAVAILPGISRSGSTIASALLIRIERDWAARFSFLLSIPAVLGAGLLEAPELFALDQSRLLSIGVSVIAAFAVGYAALHLLMHLVKRGSFYAFGYYCFAIGIFAIVLGLTR